MSDATKIEELRIVEVSGVDFPANASNAFQGLSQDLTLVFDAVEFP